MDKGDVKWVDKGDARRWVDRGDVRRWVDRGDVRGCGLIKLMQRGEAD